MGRLTEKDNSGNWCLKGMKWEQMFAGQTITEDMQERLYGALCKLKDYEDTDLSPDDVERLKEFEGSNGYRLLIEIAKHRWIPVAERLPEEDGCYLCTLKDRLSNEQESNHVCEMWRMNGIWEIWDENDVVTAWMPMPEPYMRGDAGDE